MASTDEPGLRRALIDIRESLPLRFGDESGLLAVTRSAPAESLRRPRKRWGLAVAVIAGVLLLGTTAAGAAGLFSDDSAGTFRHLHPDKSEAASDSSEEPHVELGTVELRGGLMARVYVTARPGSRSCVLVEQLDSHGEELDSIGYCSNEPSTAATVRLVNGALIGWIPDPSVSQVTVTALGSSQSAAVTNSHFVLAPTVAITSGTPETITARTTGAGETVWRVVTQ